MGINEENLNEPSPKEAGLIEGRKVALELAKKMVTELAGAEGKAAGLAAAQKAAEEEIGKQDLTGMEFVALFCFNHHQEIMYLAETQANNNAMRPPQE